MRWDRARRLGRCHHQQRSTRFSRKGVRQQLVRGSMAEALALSDDRQPVSKVSHRLFAEPMRDGAAYQVFHGDPRPRAVVAPRAWRGCQVSPAVASSRWRGAGGILRGRAELRAASCSARAAGAAGRLLPRDASAPVRQRPRRAAGHLNDDAAEARDDGRNTAAAHRFRAGSRQSAPGRRRNRANGCQPLQACCLCSPGAAWRTGSV